MRMVWWTLILAACGGAGVNDGADDDKAPDRGGDAPTLVDSDEPVDGDGVTDPGDADPADPIDPVDPPVDTDDTDVFVDTDTDAPGGFQSGADHWNHVVESVTVAPASQGRDLDGDGTIDNALGVLGGLVNPIIASGSSGATSVAILQVWGVNDGDQDVEVGFFGAVDVDNDPTDNFSGTEPFDGSLFVDAQGRALVTQATVMVNGDYSATLAQGTYIIGGLTIQTATPVYLDGTATAGVHDGLLSFAIGVPALTAILQAFGQGALAPVVANLADVDTDGDSIADALSVAFRVEGVPCVVTW